MKTLSDKTAEAYAEGKRHGYNFVKIGHRPPNPYSNQTLAEHWTAGFNDGKEEAKDEESLQYTQP